MALDLTKPVQTRDGRKVRILCQDLRQDAFCVAGAVDQGTCEEIYLWSMKGRPTGVGIEHALALINVPEERFINMFADPAGERGGFAYPSKNIALDAARGIDNYAGTYRLVPA